MGGLLGQGVDRIVDQHLFWPEQGLSRGPGDLGLKYEDLAIPTPDGLELHGWLIPAANEAAAQDPGKRPFLLFNHGNAGNIAGRLENLVRLHRLGLEVMIYDYRGYGKSPGRIGLTAFETDVLAALDFARERAGQRPLVIFGRSLGGAAATLQAATHTPAGLILEATFTCLSDMARLLFPVPGLKKILAGRLDSATRIKSVRCPIMVLHGDADDVVPFRLGRELFQAAPEPKQFVTLPGASHKNTYLIDSETYFSRLGTFVKGLPVEEY